MSRLTWEQLTSSGWSTPALIGYSGKAPIFKIVYDVFAGKGDNNKDSLSCTLAGYKKELGSYSTQEDAKIRAEQVWERWLVFSGLNVDEKGENNDSSI